MTRELETETSDAVEGGNPKWVILLQLDFDSGTVYMHTGVKAIPWNGATWLGVGSMARISGIVESADGGDDRITVALSGIPIESMPDFVDEFTEEDTAGRDWTMFMGILNSGGDLEGDASELTAGITGATDLIDGPESSVTVSLITEAALMKASLFYRMTDEDHQKIFPGDLGFEFMSDLGDEIRWGSADPKLVLPGGASGVFGLEDPRFNIIR